MLGRDNARHAYTQLNALDNPNQLRVTWKKDTDGGPIRQTRLFYRMLPHDVQHRSQFPAPPSAPPSRPCKFFLEGTCRQGPYCTFRHGDEPTVRWDLMRGLFLWTWCWFVVMFLLALSQSRALYDSSAARRLLLTISTTWSRMCRLTWRRSAKSTSPSYTRRCRAPISRKVSFVRLSCILLISDVYILGSCAFGDKCNFVHWAQNCNYLDYAFASIAIRLMEWDAIK
jgi:hypothetical protein